ncbi:B3 domain-containing transcription factor VRN1-like [Olea europaea subsp. europaea]|uniref:B3 domain-containing transcription factor VRN1-like n=1 Tax=Olea europaea subsp. europaea TaxID=158383 RepID=A0A8S0PJK8_OLEEU|nr:B3 domain-containing transcription factor VRN1-like [Olea europaea subsp. europaea]
MADRSDLPTRFFKVILPTIADQQKLLPDKYVKEFGHRLSDVVRLTDRIGGIWHVRLEKEEEIIWLHHGWEKFYEDHSIKYGYFVLFKYRGNSNFKIHVFDMTATEVHYPAHNSRNFEVTNYHPENSIPERKEESDDDSLVILDSLPPKLVGCSLRSPTPCRSALVARHDKRGKKAVNAAGISTLTYPSFTVEMKANLKPQWVVYVPAQFAKDYLPKSPKYIELQDSDGKKWKVRVNLRPNYHTVRALSTGWANFAKAKKIEVGDTCVFEIIPGNKPALKVSIYHNTGRVPRLL